MWKYVAESDDIAELPRINITDAAEGINSLERS